MASKKLSKAELEARASKARIDQTLTSYYALRGRPGDAETIVKLLPDYNLQDIVKIVRNDSIAWGAITTLIDRVLEAGWTVKDADAGTRLVQTERLLKGKDIDFWLRELLTQYILFGNAFGEIVYTPSGAIKELHVLDPRTMTIETDVHGEVIAYHQESTLTGNAVIVSWKPDEILHISDPNIGMNVWGEVPLRTVFNAVAVKYHIKKFLLWLFETNQFRGIYAIEEADEQVVIDLLTFLKKSENDITKPVVVQGKLNYLIMREFKDLNVLLEILYKMDEEILNLLQVPPIYAGLPDNSNRSNSDAQERAFDTRIKSIHKLFSYHLTKLLRKTRIYNSQFVFIPLLSQKNETAALEAAQIMKNMSVKPDLISKYLRVKGFDFPDGDIFTEPLPDMNQGVVDEKFYPSRQRKGVEQGNEKIGSGEESTTRPDQLVSRSYAGKTYPFIVED